MDIMDIQAVESKLSDVTVTPIPRSQLQNFYNYQQQREQREQQPQIQISAIHTPRDRHHHHHQQQQQQQHQSQSQSHHLNGTNNVERETTSLRDLFTNNNKRNEYQAAQLTNNSGVPSNSVTSAAVAAAALQYTQQLQAQLALLQQQVNQAAGSTTPSITLTPAVTVRPTINSNNINYNHINNITNNCTTNQISANSQYQKYPQSTSPAILTTQTSSHINTPIATNANLTVTPTIPNLNNGLSKYAQLLAIIEEMGRDIRPTYTGSRTSTERLKRGIVHARVLVRECLLETERSARQ